MTAATSWQRVEDGYARGDARIFDNGSGVGPAKGSGRWAVEVAGRWVANVDTLAEAKTRASASARRSLACSCGEPEDGGEFGWYDTEDATYCNACGSKVTS